MERVVGSCDRFGIGGYDWLPDGSGIVASMMAEHSSDPSPLAILRLDTGRWEPMSYPIAPGNVDYDPRFSSDGTRLGFRRNLVRAEIRVMPAQGGPAEQATRLRSEIMGWDWSPDDRSLLVSLGNGASRLVRYDLATHRSETLGHIPAGFLDVAPRGSKMVFTTGQARVGMFRYPLPLRAGAEAQPLFASTGSDLLPSPSPDGRTIAFHSDRSRETRLWLGEPGFPDRLRMIEGLAPLRMHPVEWSEDGSRLLLVADPDHPGNEPGPRLYEVDVASGRYSPVALEGIPYVAQYMPGGRLLVLVDLGSGKWSLRILERGTPGRVLAQLEGIGEARFDEASNQVFFVRIDTPGLWRTDPTLSSPVLLDDKVPSIYWMTRWALLDGKVMSLRSAPGCGAEWHWIGPASTPRTGCLDRDRRGVSDLALVPSRQGDWLYASMSMEDGNRDIGAVDLDGLGGGREATP
jgi:Tol biopolymer transport system component